MAALLLLASLASAATAVLLLRRTGHGWRVGRLLSAAPRSSLAEVAAMVERGEVAYLRVEGRISSEEEFPDENDQPLVYQRRRLQRRDRRGWTTFHEQRVAVPFGLEQRGDDVAIDTEALGDGLVVVPRLSTGLASELPTEEGLAAMAPDTPVRLRLDQVSSTDHATAAGVPARGPDGGPMLTAGQGRPLLLTTLEPAAAMRVLATDQRPTVLAATGLLAMAAILLLVAVAVALLDLGPAATSVATTTAGVVATAAEQGASPAASPGASPAAGFPAATVVGDVVTPGDPRSEGSGPGLVGSPLLVLLGVVLLGLLTAALTAALARLAGRS